MRPTGRHDLHAKRHEYNPYANAGQTSFDHIIPTRMNRVTKLLVIVSNLAAVWLLARQGNAGLPSLLPPTVLAFGVSFAAAAFAGDFVITVILSLVYAVPALCFAWFNSFFFPDYAIWMAALCGAMLPRSARSPWAFPARWRAPLVLWALCLALSWPIVVLRELNFVPALLDNAYLSNSRMSTFVPPLVVMWIASVAAIAMTGLLLFDWLFVAYPEDPPKRFESRIVWPLCAGAGVAAAIAVVQMFVDMSFLNRTYFWSIGRAVGTMRDANAFGIVVSLWVPVAAALVVEAGGRLRRSLVLRLALLLLFIIGVWASGSRTALLSAMVGILVLFGSVWRLLRARHLVAGMAAAVVLVVALVFVAPVSTTGPWRRIVQFVPELSRAQIVESALQLWSRDMYGRIADRMFAEHPAVGIGVGGFYYQAADILYLINHSERPPDNAQSWYRQQLAELGLVGSVGWIVWMGMWIWLFAFRRGPGDRSAIAGAVKGSMIGLAAASLLGIPTQDTAASITFIVLAAWCLKLTGAGAVSLTHARPWAGRFEWPAVLAVLACFLAGTAYEARHALRPAARAARAEYPYQYGFMADADHSEFRWTRSTAVDVFPIENRWVKLVIGAAAPDAAEKPVVVRVWRNDTLILTLPRRSDFPLERWIRLPDHERYVGLRIEVSRTWRPADFGRGADREERGVEVGKWEFVYWTPQGAVTVE
jgi:hypothetical protein